MSINAMTIARMSVDAYEAAMYASQGDYDGRVRPWRELIRGVSQGKQQGITQTVLDFLVELQAVGLLDGSAAMWLMAAFHDEAMAEMGDG